MSVGSPDSAKRPLGRSHKAWDHVEDETPPSDPTVCTKGFVQCRASGGKGPRLDNVVTKRALLVFHSRKRNATKSWHFPRGAASLMRGAVRLKTWRTAALQISDGENRSASLALALPYSPRPSPASSLAVGSCRTIL